MIEKGFTILLILVMVIVGYGMLYGRTVQKSPLPPRAVVTMPDAYELEMAGLQQATGLQAGDLRTGDLLATERLTQPVTVKLAVPVSVALFPPIDDDREARAQVIWRLTFAAALGLILLFSLWLLVLAWRNPGA